MKTIKENLKEAFCGESQASQKYLAVARKAEQQGFPNIARLFRTTAEAERIHAEGHLKALEMLNSTIENLQAAIDGETYEYKEMYPPMLEQAEKDGHKAKRMFNFAMKAEEVHARIYKLALEAAQRGEDMEDIEFYLCPYCGYIELGKPEAPCPICGAKPNKFMLIK